jgi:hypothetical protein
MYTTVWSTLHSNDWLVSAPARGIAAATLIVCYMHPNTDGRSHGIAVAAAAGNVIVQ